MNVNAILQMVSKMFPSVNLSETAQKAQQMMAGTPDTLDGVSQAARKMGITAQTVNEIFDRYGNTMQAQALCKMFGTTPQALKNDADRILGASQPSATNSATPQNMKFPRLK